MKMYANHGRISKYDHEFEGINSRMDGIQGAVLGIKLKHLDKWCSLRRKHAEYYCEQLKSVTEIVLPHVPQNCTPVYHLFVIRTEKRDELMNFLQSNDISVGIHYPIALPNLLAYKYLGHKPADFPVANDYQTKILSLPIYPEIEKAELDYVISKVKEFFKK
jgi:dTDP-4-amino-4,6-dideoxygalactose transaminase